MSSSKKRKRITAPESQVSAVSALAARRNLKAEQTTEVKGIPEPERLPRSAQLEVRSETKPGISKPRHRREKSEPQNALGEVPALGLKDEIRTQISEADPNYSDRDDSLHSSRASSPDELPPPPLVSYSNFQPCKENFKLSKNGNIILNLAPGERLVILGEYEILIQRGQITLLGAALDASKTPHKVHASSSYSLPVIRCLATNVDHAVLQIHQSRSGLRNLHKLSPLFSKLWNDASASIISQHSSMSTENQDNSFQILFSSHKQRAFLQPITSPPEWNQALASISAAGLSKAPRVLLCGPKSSGKSTFAKLLSNRLLTSNVSGRPSSGVILLDIDPGQSEYSNPGHVSLFHLREPNFGPPFSHPSPTKRNTLIRSHTIGAITPSEDPSFYVSCVLDLYSHYLQLRARVPTCPLVINTAGWILGTGLEILTKLISKTGPSSVVYMSQEGPWDVVETLKEAATGATFLTLPSQSSEYVTRTAAQLRSMQSMSYFHLDAASGGLKWTDTPLSFLAPWEINYSTPSSTKDGRDEAISTGILGIVHYGEVPPASLLLEAINGTLVSIVVIEEDAALTPGLESPGLSGAETPRIIRTPEDLPYFNPSLTHSLDPRHSRCIGQALIRGVSISRKRLQVITPIPDTVIDAINAEGQNIVLVAGKFDIPGWAYTEDLIYHGFTAKQRAIAGDGYEDMAGFNGDVGEPSQNTPWVEELKGSSGRGFGSRVWRVRRDLGRNAAE